MNIEYFIVKSEGIEMMWLGTAKPSDKEGYTFLCSPSGDAVLEVKTYCVQKTIRDAVAERMSRGED